MVRVEDLVGAAEAANVLNLTSSRINQLRRAAEFPKPIHEVGATPLWLAPDLLKWEAERIKGKPGRPRKGVADAGVHPDLAGSDS